MELFGGYAIQISLSCVLYFHVAFQKEKLLDDCQWRSVKSALWTFQMIKQDRSSYTILFAWKPANSWPNVPLCKCQEHRMWPQAELRTEVC